MKRFLLCITGVVLLSAAVTFVGTGVASANPLPAIGTANCAISGTGTFHPHLLASGTSFGETVKFLGTSSSCTASATVTTAGTPVTITGMTVKGVGKLSQFGHWHVCQRLPQLQHPGCDPGHEVEGHVDGNPGHPANGGHLRQRHDSSGLTVGIVRPDIGAFGSDDHHYRLVRFIAGRPPGPDHQCLVRLFLDLGPLLRLHLR